MEGNLLYYGDNLDVLRRHIADESVDLVYLDPPFNSNANYNAFFKEHGKAAVAQIKAFEDTWRWDDAAGAAYDATVTAGGKVADAMVAFRRFLGDTDMLAYLSMMAPRLVQLRRVLKSSGSIYLHCDPTASHYLKMLMDAIFGPENFSNEIVWCYRGGGVPRKAFARKHDTLLAYAREAKDVFFEPQFIPYSEASQKLIAGRGGVSIDDLPRDLERGAHMPDWWPDLNSLQTWSPERLGYPTQKPEPLLERIINASSRPGDLVLDPFCGCGTAVVAAQRLGRRWIGIDITHVATGLIKRRLADTFGDEIAKEYRVVGEPTTLDDAVELASDDPFQFQAWALGLVGARQAGSDKKGADRGIDGRLYFTEGKHETKEVIFSVKAGATGAAHVRDLRGVVDREGASVGVLISMRDPTREMRSEATSAGFYESPWGKHPRIQLLTVGELLAGRGIDYPRTRGANVTYKKAQPAKITTGDQLDLVAEGGPDEPYGEPDSN